MSLSRCILKLNILLAILSSLWAVSMEARSPATTPPPQRGILLVTFGSSYPEAQVAFERIDAMARKRWPDTPIYWAYTSDFIRKKLLKRGERHDAPIAAMAQMHDAGIREIAVQSLHVIAGVEYEEIVSAVDAFQSTNLAFERVTIGRPLLASAEDVYDVADLILAEAAESRAEDEALVLMGHGSGEHPADLTYLAAASVFQKRDATAFLATVEGHPTFEDLLAQLQQAGVQRAALMPFMSVAGDHARNDLAGEEPDSWKSQLEAAGIECSVILRGMGEMPALVDQWLAHLQIALDELAELDEDAL
ncbi:sirohydrochlorin cobaltochelatase [Coraliomargarita algicola]|uniref:Sirohydrochlorin cobaltochelatase n=1 Tax=Coraliomargarita algicola TaxID=3092156 RepID=A0ABZ0RF12_9BACT|nr:sirohydrochlorin cobaltochelatase [Coraliomargarita sp. J2-16]WPJ94631.1 sirohydrochlorin cobaltochelatase [Coraliomargarita sp. J2-16]